jgi:hypothetical protein
VVAVVDVMAAHMDGEEEVVVEAVMLQEFKELGGEGRAKVYRLQEERASVATHQLWRPTMQSWLPQ